MGIGGVGVEAEGSISVDNEGNFSGDLSVDTAGRAGPVSAEIGLDFSFNENGIVDGKIGVEFGVGFKDFFDVTIGFQVGVDVQGRGMIGTSAGVGLDLPGLEGKVTGNVTTTDGVTIGRLDGSLTVGGIAIGGVIEGVISTANPDLSIGDIIAPPIVLDLDGDGIELVSFEQSTIYFDHDGDGLLERTGWVAKDDGILVRDFDGNGLIEGISEISFARFGSDPHSDLVGLRAFDSNQDGLFNGGDGEFSAFRIWQDVNQNGLSETDELRALSSLGVSGINLARTPTGQTPSTNPNDNVVTGRSQFIRGDGGSGEVADVGIRYSNPDSRHEIKLSFSGDMLYAVGTLNNDVLTASGGGLATLFGMAGNDQIMGGSGADMIRGGDGDDAVFGSAADDTLNGNGGIDRLDGGTGADRLDGGAGNDVFVVDNAGDVVIEVLGGGAADEVQSTISYTLPTEVERLTLVGAGNLDGVGNAKDNVLVGNGGDNLLSGSLGADTLSGLHGIDRLDGGTGVDQLDGGAGNDVYIVDNAGDVVVEMLSLGNADEVQSSISYTLPAEVENLTLTGTANLDGTGNDKNNVLVGNGGNNLLSGGGGVDQLIGNGGDDTLAVANLGFASVDGGNGFDTLRLGVGGTIDLTAFLSKLQGIEAVDLAGASGGTNLQVAMADVLPLSPDSNTLLVRGQADDTVAFDAADNFTSVGTQTVGAVVFNAFASGSATVLVQQGIGVVGESIFPA